MKSVFAAGVAALMMSSAPVYAGAVPAMAGAAAAAAATAAIAAQNAARQAQEAADAAAKDGAQAVEQTLGVPEGQRAARSIYDPRLFEGPVHVTTVWFRVRDGDEMLTEYYTKRPLDEFIRDKIGNRPVFGLYWDMRERLVLVFYGEKSS